MDADALIGRTFGGRWKVDKKLSSGGMGALYVASHADSGRKAALKVIRPRAAPMEGLSQRFRHEVEALASITHPNIVALLDSGVDEGDLFLVMELLEGRSLRRELKRSGPMPWRRALRIGADVARALSAVHKRGLIHRDLKPDNVFLMSSEGHSDFVKLLDFGVARVPEKHVTRTGIVVGTAGYIAPEQLRDQPPTPASDVYALGVMLYEMVAGEAPFKAASFEAMVVKQMGGSVAPPSAHADVPGDVDAIILKLMARVPEERPPDAEAALALLCDDSGAPPPLEKTEKLVRMVKTQEDAVDVTERIIAPTVDVTVRSTVAPHDRRPLFVGAGVGVAIVAVVAVAAWAWLPRAPVSQVTAAVDPAPAAGVDRGRPPAAADNPAPVDAPAPAVAEDPPAVADATSRAVADERARTSPARGRLEVLDAVTAEVRAAARAHASLFAACGGDTSPRRLAVAAYANGTMRPLGAAADPPMACAQRVVRMLRVPRFSGPPVPVPLSVVVGRVKPPPPPNLPGINPLGHGR